MSKKLSERFFDKYSTSTNKVDYPDERQISGFEHDVYHALIEKESLEKQLANYTKRNEKLSRLLKEQTGGVTLDNDLNAELQKLKELREDWPYTWGEAQAQWPFLRELDIDGYIWDNKTMPEQIAWIKDLKEAELQRLKEGLRFAQTVIGEALENASYAGDTLAYGDIGAWNDCWNELKELLTPNQ